MVNVDLAHAIIAQGRDADAVAAVERIDTVPVPCDLEWVVKRHAAALARVAGRAALKRGVAAPAVKRS